jgi:hypothetical protein
VTPDSAARRGPVGEFVDLTPLKTDARAGYPPAHPYRLAVEALPELVPRVEFQTHLRLLLPLSRVREER